MKEFEVTLTAVSRKTFKLRADSQGGCFPAGGGYSGEYRSAGLFR